MSATFADRLWWARRRSGMGATMLAEKAGCTRSLISGLERMDRESSRFNDKFAAILGVDKNWLREGKGRVPDGFDPKKAREEHEREKNAYARGERNVVELQPRSRWAEQAVNDPAPETNAAALQKRLMADFMEYARQVGGERTKVFLDLLHKTAELVLAEAELARQNDVGA